MKKIKVIDFLIMNFNNVNSWLIYAEAKHAANLAFCVAAIAIYFSCPKDSFLYLLFVIACAASGILSMISFWPFTGKNGNKTSEPNENDNLFFYEDIKKYSNIAYLTQVYKKYRGELDFDFKSDEKDLADEVIYNSNVSSRKYRLFKWVVVVDTLALLFLLLGAVCSFFNPTH